MEAEDFKPMILKVENKKNDTKTYYWVKIEVHETKDLVFNMHAKEVSISTRFNEEDEFKLLANDMNRQPKAGIPEITNIFYEWESNFDMTIDELFLKTTNLPKKIVQTQTEYIIYICE